MLKTMSKNLRLSLSSELSNFADIELLLKVMSFLQFPPFKLSLGLPKLIDPHLCQQHTGLQNTVFWLLQEVT